MKTRLILTILGLFLIAGCSKTAQELLEMSDENLKTNDIDAAVGDLNSIISKYPDDSLASLAQYKLSTIHLNWNNDLLSGFEALQHTVDNYPNSVQATQAKKEIENFPEFILNNVESLRKRKMIKEALDYLVYMTDKHSQHALTPKGQYIIGDIYMNDLRDFETAILSYRKVIDDYAGSIQEPNAQFMIGYVFANILFDYKSAEIEYMLFLDRFPNHELAPSIRFELENLGKNIDEIPALKHISS
ncbi:MAG: tetratricopeptide repeat protein [Candidatus Neomarinimicrobiota bacterium]|nr:tetratricopeptide repeat protein [Candidatus Neomarinimicrobiota bacterium]